MANKSSEGESEVKKELSGTLPATRDFDRPLNPITRVSLTRSEQVTTDDSALWAAIRNRTEAISFKNFADFMTRVFCTDDGRVGDRVCKTELENNTTDTAETTKRGISLKKDLLASPSIYGVDAYNLLKLAS